MKNQKKRIVIKIGTSILTRSSESKSRSTLAGLIREVCAHRSEKYEFLLVTSGAIGAGIRKLKWSKRPSEIRRKQAAAAVGQVALMQTYQKLFKNHRACVAQVLLTRSDFGDRRRYLNARNTLLTLLELNVVPIINENDTVAVEEIQFGDNDNLSALVAAKINADLLIILSDVNGLYRSGSGVVSVVSKIDSGIEKLAWKGGSSDLGTGGMSSKIEAAKTATSSGVSTIVASGFKPGVIGDILSGENVGTKFIAMKALSAKEKWILFGAVPKGELLIDRGAVSALKDSKKSLLPAGIVRVKGMFHKGDVIRIKTEGNEEIARGITSFSSGEVERIKGFKTGEMKKVLGSSGLSAYSEQRCEVVHRNSLALIPSLWK